MENFNVFMRRLFSLISSFLLISVAISCDTEIQIYPDEPNPGIVLNASFVGGNSTKTEFGRMTSTHSYAEVLWSYGDSLSLFFNDPIDGLKNARLVTKQPNGQKAVFFPDPDIQISGSSFIGLYPYNKDASVTDGLISTVVPSVQTAKEASFDPSAMLAVGAASAFSSETELDMDFYNVCSGICFTLTANAGQYKRIVFKGNNGELISGPVTISAVGTSEPLASAADGASDFVELLPPNNGAFKPGVEYYICFLPQEFTSGFSMYFCTDAQQLPAAEKCTASVKFSRGRFAVVNVADTHGKLGKIRTGVALDELGTANCYVVSKPGCYKFRMVKGNDESQTLSGVTSVAVLWETVNTTTAPAVGSVVDNVVFNGQYIYFDTPAKLKDGNAIIAAYKDNDILWSWHIWVCADSPIAKAQTIIGKPRAMLDRNLGALESNPNGYALCNGLIYQWGRKDPFPGAAQSYSETSPGGSLIATTAGALKLLPSNSEVTVEYAVKHPDAFITNTKNWLYVPDATLWAEEKTIYDPCPAGWKVPTTCKFVGSSTVHDLDNEAWSVDEAYWQRVAGQYYGMFFTLSDGSSRSWYPNAGYLGCDGVLYMLGEYCCYWSCNRYGDNVYAMEMYKNNSTGKLTYTPYRGGHKRGEGNYVRCIEDK